MLTWNRILSNTHFPIQGVAKDLRQVPFAVHALLVVGHLVDVAVDHLADSEESLVDQDLVHMVPAALEDNPVVVVVVLVENFPTDSEAVVAGLAEGHLDVDMVECFVVEVDILVVLPLRIAVEDSHLAVGEAVVRTVPEQEGRRNDPIMNNLACSYRRRHLPRIQRSNSISLVRLFLQDEIEKKTTLRTE